VPWNMVEVAPERWTNKFDLWPHFVSAISGNFESKTTKKRAPTVGSKGFVLS